MMKHFSGAGASAGGLAAAAKAAAERIAREEAARNEITFGYDNGLASGKRSADGKPCLIAHYDGTAHGNPAEILHVRRNMP